jgi:hypothetical protein
MPGIGHVQFCLRKPFGFCYTRPWLIACVAVVERTGIATRKGLDGFLALSPVDKTAPRNESSR